VAKSNLVLQATDEPTKVTEGRAIPAIKAVETSKEMDVQPSHITIQPGQMPHHVRTRMMNPSRASAYLNR
jgi:hypothetical protein